MKSIVHDVEEESIVPDMTTVKKRSVGKLRKLLRDFYRDIGLNKGTKHSKMSVTKLRSFVSRNRYQEMLYGDDDMAFIVDDDINKNKDKSKKPKKKEKEKERVKDTQGHVVNVYTAKESPEKED